MTYTITQGVEVVTLNDPVDIGRKSVDDVQMIFWRDETFGSAWFGNSGDLLNIKGIERIPPYLDFDGASDKISLTTGYTATGAFTFCFWATLIDNASSRGIIGDDAAIANGYIMYNTSNQVAVVSASGTTNVTLTSTPTEGANVWHHWAITRDGSNNIDVYLDGTNITSGSPVRAGNIQFDRLFDVPTDSSDKAWYGKIRDARLFTDAKSAADILLIRDGNEITTNLEAHWKINYRDPDVPSDVADETGSHDASKADPDWNGTMIDMHYLESMQGAEITIAGLPDSNFNTDYYLKGISCRAVKGCIYQYEYNLNLMVV